MTLSDRLEIPAEVMARQVGEETVILQLESGTYYGLDPVGARIWQLIGDGRNLGEVCGAMLEEYEVEREQLEADVLELAGEMEAKGLVRRVLSDCNTSS